MGIKTSDQGLKKHYIELNADECAMFGLQEFRIPLTAKLSEIANEFIMSDSMTEFINNSDSDKQGMAMIKYINENAKSILDALPELEGTKYDYNFFNNYFEGTTLLSSFVMAIFNKLLLVLAETMSSTNEQGKQTNHHYLH